jgi:hypothetical protein
MSAVDLRNTVNEPPVITPEVDASTTITVDTEPFPSDTGLAYDIKIYVDEIVIFEGTEPAGFDTSGFWIDYVVAKYTAAGYFCIPNNPSVEIYGATGLGASINDKVNAVSYRDENTIPFTNALNSSPAFSGGVTESEKRYAVKLNV